MSVKRIAVGGSAANPPTIGHRDLVQVLLESNQFDQVIWIPSGVRADKPDFVDPDHRVAMTLLTFPQKWFLQPPVLFFIKFSDIYGENTPTIEHLVELQNANPESEVVWYTGVDSVVPQEKFGGKCEIEACWVEGEELMKNWPFFILPRVGFPHPDELDLPPLFEVSSAQLPDVSSTELRNNIAFGRRFEHLVTPDVANYIKRHGLYGWKGETL